MNFSLFTELVSCDTIKEFSYVNGLIFFPPDVLHHVYFYSLAEGLCVSITSSLFHSLSLTNQPNHPTVAGSRSQCIIKVSTDQ